MKSSSETQPLSLADLPTVDEALKAFGTHIIEYRRVLHDEGIWLFLSTVGCWGVPHPIFQSVAYGITVVLFGERVKSRYTERKSFTKLAKALETRIERESDEAAVRIRQLVLLEQLRKKQLSGVWPL